MNLPELPSGFTREVQRGYYRLYRVSPRRLVFQGRDRKELIEVIERLWEQEREAPPEDRGRVVPRATASSLKAVRTHIRFRP